MEDSLNRTLRRSLESSGYLLNRKTTWLWKNTYYNSNDLTVICMQKLGMAICHRPAYHFKLRRRLMISGVGVLWFRPGVLDESLWNGLRWIPPPPPVLNCEMEDAGVPKEPGEWLVGDGDTRTWEKFWDNPEEFENNWCCGWLDIPDGDGEIEGATNPTLWNGGVRFTLNGSSTGVGGIDRCSWCTVGWTCALGRWGWVLRLPNKFKFSFEVFKFKWLREACWCWLSFIEWVLDKNEELLTCCVNSVTLLQKNNNKQCTSTMI